MRARPDRVAGWNVGAVFTRCTRSRKLASPRCTARSSRCRVAITGTRSSPDDRSHGVSRRPRAGAAPASTPPLRVPSGSWDLLTGAWIVVRGRPILSPGSQSTRPRRRRFRGRGRRPPAAGAACALTRSARACSSLIADAGQPAKAYDLLEQLRNDRDADGATAQPRRPRCIRAGFLLANGFIHKLESVNAFVACHHPNARTSIRCRS